MKLVSLTTVLALETLDEFSSWQNQIPFQQKHESNYHLMQNPFTYLHHIWAVTESRRVLHAPSWSPSLFHNAWKIYFFNLPPSPCWIQLSCAVSPLQLRTLCLHLLGNRNSFHGMSLSYNSCFISHGKNPFFAPQNAVSWGSLALQGVGSLNFEFQSFFKNHFLRVLVGNPTLSIPVEIGSFALSSCCYGYSLAY